MCNQSVCHASWIFVINREHWSTVFRQIFYFHFCSFLIILIKCSFYQNKKCLWTRSMTGESMDPVQKWGSMDQGSMFCPHPDFSVNISSFSSWLYTLFHKMFWIFLKWTYFPGFKIQNMIKMTNDTKIRGKEERLF